MVYIARKDIKLRDRTVKAGLPLPERFQNRYCVKLLKRDLGEDAIGVLEANDPTYKVVSAGAYDALVAENKHLYREMEKLTAPKSKREETNAA
jgi:hypothetical protein